MSKNPFESSKMHTAAVERAMKIAEEKLGVDKEKLKRLNNPAELSKMLKQLSEEDMAKLELILKNPKSLDRLLTPDNMAKIKKMLEGK